MSPKGEKGKLREFPSFPLLGFLGGGREQSSPLHLLASHEIYGRSEGRYEGVLVHPETTQRRRSPKLLSGASKRSFAVVQHKGNLPALL